MPPGPPRQLREQRFAFLAGLVLAGFGLVVLGVLRLQVVQHDEFQRLAQQNRVRLDVLRAPRGAILDRRGRKLADNQPSFDIVFRPMPAESTERARSVVSSDWIARVAGLLQSDTIDVFRRVREANRTGQTAILRRSAPYGVMAAVEESRVELPGLDVQVTPIRHYVEGTLAAQLLGYAGEINDRELEQRAEQGYRLGDLLGKTGLERRYEEVLRGQDGAEYVIVNARGKRVATLSEGPPKRPVPGHDIVLTLDLDVQRAMEEAMAHVERGAAVAIDPRDGGILGMLSKPNFDPNEFSRGLSFARWNELNSGGAYPLLNRAIQSAYPPGSTFKIVTMLAGLDNDIVTAHTHEPTGCNGGYQFGTRRFGCWDKRGHGSIDLVAALQFSCDVYFYQLGLQLGLDRLQSTARALGLGERTGIDLPSEARGLVPTDEYYDKRWGVGRWRRGVLLNLAIGQGEMLATPLQLALMTAIVANGGRAIRPHVVGRVIGAADDRGERPIEPGLVTSSVHWATLHDALRKVVDAGTGTSARVQGIGVAGKTGTAQNPHGDDHALFVCYAPIEAPTIAIAIVSENSGHGGSVSAPIAGRILRKLFLPDSLQNPPVRARARRDTVAADTSEVIGD